MRNDVVAAEVHRKAIQNLTDEMAMTLVRTSGSSIVTDSKDFSTCLLDTIPEHLGFSSAVLFHVGSSLIGTQTISELAKQSDDLRPGDGWIVNDPHTGGAMHQADISVIMPTFFGGEHMGWSFGNVHVLDVGGVGVSGYAPGAYDVYQEGLRFPPIKIIRNGAIDTEWEHFIAANVRAPGPVLNDIRSLIAANNTAARKLIDVISGFGIERHREYCVINKDLTERLMRERISRIPDGVYYARDWNEFDGHDGPDLLLELELRLEVDGTDMRFYYSGVPQIDAFVNSTMGAMFGQTMTALMTTLVYGDMPVNGGLWRPLMVDVGEPGTIVNSLPPAPVSNAHTEVGLRACKLTKDVLNQALALSDDPVLRGRVAGQGQDGFPGNALFGQNQHGDPSVIFYPDNSIGSGGGAQTIHDGQDGYGLTCTTGGGIPDIEEHEGSDGVLFLWRRLIPQSGGPGANRGGQGLEQAYALHYSDRMVGPAFNACAEVPPHGVGGGFPGNAGNFYPIRNSNVADLLAKGIMPTRERVAGQDEQVHSKISHMIVNRGDVFVALSGGGGGVGDPLFRDPANVVLDVQGDYISADHAKTMYGVVLDTNGGLDVEATTFAREEIGRARIGSEPSRAMNAPASIGVSVVVDGGEWTCASCGTHLGSTSGNLRDAAVLREARVAQRYAELGMFVRERTEEPGVLIREYYCPTCAAALVVDIAVEGTETLRSPKVPATSGAK
jgi:N-methylhydantoinase B